MKLRFLFAVALLFTAIFSFQSDSLGDDFSSETSNIEEILEGILINQDFAGDQTNPGCHTGGPYTWALLCAPGANGKKVCCRGGPGAAGRCCGPVCCKGKKRNGVYPAITCGADGRTCTLTYPPQGQPPKQNPTTQQPSNPTTPPTPTIRPKQCVCTFVPDENFCGPPQPMPPNYTSSMLEEDCRRRENALNDPYNPNHVPGWKATCTWNGNPVNPGRPVVAVPCPSTVNNTVE